MLWEHLITTHTTDTNETVAIEGDYPYIFYQMIKYIKTATKKLENYYIMKMEHLEYFGIITIQKHMLIIKKLERMLNSVECIV